MGSFWNLDRRGLTKVRRITIAGLLGGLLLAGGTTPADAQVIGGAPSFVPSGAAGIRLVARSSRPTPAGEALGTWLAVLGGAAHISREQNPSAPGETSPPTLGGPDPVDEVTTVVGGRLLRIGAYLDPERPSFVPSPVPSPGLRSEGAVPPTAGRAVHRVRTLRLEVF